ncbi:hypothetical protein LWI28_015771 [Acer negundo]|uniref:Uncharacterized protein n=1 Tax=Acer negundo TaxID=4023 RepID=A0AAD5IF60_ACENE|nr:hypothetical protein LWI28_015771 [Acer negundo]KAK4837560.1 hypothetical protein QYF36_006499 [Acer negundo]
MSQLCGSNVVIPTEFDVGFDDLDRVPLITRQKLLLASKTASKSPIDVIVKNEEGEENNVGLLSFLSSCAASGIDQQLAFEQRLDSEVPFGVTSVVSYGETAVGSSAVDQCPQASPYHLDVGTPGDCNCQSIHINTKICSDQTTHVGLNADVSGPEKVHFNVCTCDKNQVLSSVPVEVKVENSDNHVLSSSGDGVNDFASVDVSVAKANSNDFSFDDLDHIALKERQRMLQKRKLLELAKHVVEGTSVGMSEDLTYPSAGRIKEETQPDDVGSLVVGNECNEIPIHNASDLGKISVNGSSDNITPGSSSEAKQYSEIPGCSPGTEATNSGDNAEKCDKMWSSERTYLEKVCDGQHDVPESGSMHVSFLPNSVKVKVEPLENSDLQHPEINVSSKFPFNTQAVKSELGIPNELLGDELDHILLQDRKKLQKLGENSNLMSSSYFAFSSKTEHPSFQYSFISSESANPIKVNRQRKRKKTATDSVEKALEEDAPGLLQVLVEQGVSVDEIRLYGETEGDDDLDDTFNEENFAELEAVMTKIFFQRESLLKFAPIRCTKGLKPSYCLACLFSLVEQARYLQFRNWPVEWGWCRDLQSFIFVFKRHNRIVLERPEYGYATYFFELVDSLSTEWQVKRLVTAMKLTSFGRVNLIENKTLSVGEDLSEGEAKVLMDFGWLPNTGLGTMLNYHDRVYHDRKNEKDISEWRSKIGKLLVDGYNGGTIVSTNVSENIIINTGSDGPQIKLEL